MVRFFQDQLRSFFLSTKLDQLADKKKCGSGLSVGAWLNADKDGGLCG